MNEDEYLARNPWRPIETAPKDGTFIDISAKCWDVRTDTFTQERFTRVYWREADHLGAWREGWTIDEGWRPTHWMPIPADPKL